MAIVLTAVLAALSSCRTISNFIHDDEVVAKAGERVLYRSELAEFIPVGASPEDSAKLAAQYINTWAVEGLIQDLAATKLSKQELDVTAELEDYRSSLIKYRYEQRYINDRLDTVVSHIQVEDYYNAHKEMFVLSTPIVKARFLDIMKGVPTLETLRKKMSSSDFEDLAAADSIAYTSALKYVDGSDQWVDVVSYARNFETDYGTLLSKVRSDGYVEIEGDGGDLKIGYIVEMRRQGTIAPIEYCERRIKDIIISNRKRVLMSTLEQELLDDALEKGNLIIY